MGSHQVNQPIKKMKLSVFLHWLRPQSLPRSSLRPSKNHLTCSPSNRPRKQPQLQIKLNVRLSVRLWQWRKRQRRKIIRRPRRTRKIKRRRIRKTRKMTRKIKKKTKRITSRRKRKTKRREKKTRKMTRKTRNKKIKIKKNKNKTIKIRKTRKRARRIKNVNLLSKRRTKKLSTKPWTLSAKESQRLGHGSKIRVTGSVKSATRVKCVPTFATTTFPSRQLFSVIMENGWTLDSLMTNVSKFLARPLTFNSIHNLLYILILATKKSNQK